MKSKIIIEVEHEGELTNIAIRNALKEALTMKEKGNAVLIMPMDANVEFIEVTDIKFPDRAGKYRLDKI